MKNACWRIQLPITGLVQLALALCLLIGTSWIDGARAQIGSDRQTFRVDTAEEFGQAILAANQFSMDNGPMAFTTILLDGDVQLTTGLPPISGRVVIQRGGDFGNFRGISGGGVGSNFRAFEVLEGGELTMSLVAFQDFVVADDGGVISVAMGGTLKVFSCRFKDNSAEGDGGAIFVRGNSELFVQSCRFEDNSAGQTGGAIYAPSQDKLTVYANQFITNQATFACNVHVSQSIGRGVVRENEFINDCPTFDVDVPSGDVLFHNNTFRNTNVNGTAVQTTSDQTVEFSSNVVEVPSNNRKLGCFDPRFSVFQSRGHNIGTDDSCMFNDSTDLPATDPGLVLTDDGVLGPAANSPAIDSARTENLDPFTLGCQYADIRGLGRPQDANGDGVFECDRGAYEVQGGDDIGAAQSGAYFDTGRNGEGAFVEILPGGFAFVTVFTYLPDASGPAWFVGLGELVGNSIVVGELLVTSGGIFGPGFDPGLVERTSLGGLSLVFSDCPSGGNPGRLSFAGNQDLGYEALLAQATRLSSIVACQAGAPTAQSGRSGSFFAPERDGEGVIIQHLTDGRVVLIWYTYDANGNQFWLISSTAEFDGSTITASMIYPAGSTGFGSAFDPGEIDLQDWGTITVTYSGCNDIELAYASTVAEFGTGSLDYTRLTTLDGTVCQ